MIFFLQKVANDLKYFSESLQNKSILINKPWALIDSDNELQKLIFKKDKKLIISKDGQVVEGSWDYFPEAKSLLINRGRDKILCNEGFIDEGVLILKLDGTKNKFFVLANENIVPDLDAIKYLKNLRYKKLFIETRRLKDGRILELYNEQKYNDNGDFYQISKVSFDGLDIDDGTYEVEVGDHIQKKLIVKDSVIQSIFFGVKYKTNNGLEILVQQYLQNKYLKGDNVWINEKPASDGEYRIINGRNIIVKDGKILKKKLF